MIVTYAIAKLIKGYRSNLLLLFAAVLFICVYLSRYQTELKKANAALELQKNEIMVLTEAMKDPGLSA